MITRFAPSPTGPLHLGHAYSACLGYDLSGQAGGTFLLRIEDIDQSRCRAEWETQIYDDLTWLGLTWPEPVIRQSERMDAYEQALNNLWEADLLYPCDCNRRDIRAAASAPQEGAILPVGPDGLIYPGTCRKQPRPKKRPQNTALRLDLSAALTRLGKTDFSYLEEGPGGGLVKFAAKQLPSEIGDIVLARKDMGTSYHLSVVLDDAAQNISHVVRGDDLIEATKIHVLLQELLSISRPIYHHHRLIRDEAGKRLAKRDDARALSKYRADGLTPNDIRNLIGLPITAL